jgi:hypothetical protein
MQVVEVVLKDGRIVRATVSAGVYIQESTGQPIVASEVVEVRGLLLE